MKHEINTSVNLKKNVTNSKVRGSTVRTQAGSNDTDIKASIDVGGDVTDTKITGSLVEEISDNPEIKELLDRLKQLEAVISNSSELSDARKKTALEQVKALAEAGKDPKDESMKEKANDAIGFIQVILNGLPTAAKLVEQCNKLLPAIAPFFGL